MADGTSRRGLQRIGSAALFASATFLAVITGSSAVVLGQTLPSQSAFISDLGSGPSNPYGVLLDRKAPTPASDACAKLESWSLRPTWNIPYLATSQTLIPDCTGVRGALADLGIGVGLNNIENGNVNFLSQGKPEPQGQQYVGQKPTAFSLTVTYVTFDLNRILGIPDAKVVTGFKVMEPTWATIGPNYFGLNSLYYDQLLLHDHLELQLGYIENDFEYIGVYVGGRLAGGTLGPQATIPYEVGLSNNISTAPTANVKVSYGDFYDKAGVQRSNTPGGNVRYAALDPTGFDFTIPGTSPLVIDELGYQIHPTAGAHSVWLRAGGIYNFTQFPGFGTAPSATNYAFYGLADYQLLQTYEPQTGIFVGGSFMYAPPDVNIYSKYFELRLYDVGPLPGRPHDFTSLVATRTEFGGNAINYYDRIGVRTHDASTGVTASYTAHIVNGLWIGTALTYTHNPAFRVQPGDPNALNGQLVLTLWE